MFRCFVVVGVFLSLNVFSGEHGGKEHGGKEHGGKPADTYSDKQIKETLTRYINSKTGQNKLFVYTDKDSKTSSQKILKLKFKKIHDPVRHMKNKGLYFACTDFSEFGNADKLYDLDFWLKPKGKTLEVVQDKLHKDPVWSKNKKKWEKEARYDFVGENIRLLTN